MEAITTVSTLPEETRLARWIRDVFGFRAFCFLLASLLLVAFWDVICGSQTFFFRDYGIFGYPVAHFHKACFWRGEIPLWNPLNACGLPFLAQWNTLVLYPGSLIYLLLPLPWSLSFYCVLHLGLAGAGMYRLAMAWTDHQLGAAVAGLGFALSGLLLNALMWPNNIAALGWMPWVVLLFERGWIEGRRSLLLAILIGAIQMLSGAPEIILFTWAILMAVWTGHFWRNTELRIRLVLRGAMTVAFVGGLVAAQILPFLDMLLHSQRGANFSDAHWALPASGWVHFFLPLFGFYQSPSGVCFQPQQEWTSSYYVGIGIMLLAIVSGRALDNPRVKFLWIIAGAGLLLALGNSGWMYAVVSKLPILSVMRFPIKFIVLVVFALPMLAAFGLRALGNEDRARWWLIGATALCAAVIAGALAFAYVRPPTRLAWSILAANASGRLVCVVLIAVLVSMFRRAADLKRRTLPGCGLLIVVALDLLTHAPWQNPTVTPSVYEAGILATQVSPLPTNGTHRAMMTRRTHDVVYSWMLPDTFKDYCGRRLSMFGNCNILDDVPVPDGFYSLYLPRQREIWADVFFETNSQAAEPLADFLGISQAATNLFEWEHRPAAMPIATAGQMPVFAEAAAIRASINAPDFEPRRTVYLPARHRGKITATNHVTATISPSRWENRHVEFIVDAQSPTLLVVAQSFHHNWRAYVDGKPTEVFEANHAFQAVAVPTGRSRVELIYEDNAFQAGSAASVMSLALWAGLWARQRRRVTASERVSP